jgi:hypothetical protein
MTNGNRWYDGWKGVAVLVGILAGAASFGYATRDAMMAIRGIPGIEQRQRDVNTALWQTVNTQMEVMTRIREDVAVQSEATLELICAVRARTEIEQAGCISAGTTRRLEAIQQRRR